MNTTETNTQKNLSNLYSFWRTAAQAHEAIQFIENFECSYRQQNDWPARIWHNDSPSEQEIALLQEKASSFSYPLVCPFQHPIDKPLSFSLEKYGFVALFKQTGMSLELKNKYSSKETIVFEAVTNNKLAMQWSDLFFKAFNYRIDASFVLPVSPDTMHYLLYHKQKPIGTVSIHFSNQTAGIHALGIIPEARGKGFATSIMQQVLYIIQEKGFKEVFLQASDMGIGIYKKLGFQSEFIIQNYLINKD